MRAFSTREVAHLLGESKHRVRAAARAGFVAPSKTPQGHFRFSFQDLVLLRSTSALARETLGVRRTWRALRAVRAALPAGRPLCSVRVVTANNRVLVRENNTSWDPESGQTLFEFAAADIGPSATAAARSVETKLVATDSAEYWFERGLRHDRGEAPEDAARAYRRALDLDPDHVSARINLGRLLHTSRDYDGAEALYREALELWPDHAVAAFNLGVVLEDRGAIDAAMESYRRAVSADPALPDAHYNLARLYEWRGERTLAVRHMARFRVLSRDDG
jgi:tetratricopeptide (TPR) repeat protein